MKFCSLIVLAFTTASISLAADTPRYPAWDSKATIAEYAKSVQLEPSLTLDLGDGVKWEGVLVPAGTYVMGSPKGEAKTAEESAREAQHKVTLTQPFYIGRFETTQAQYEKVAKSNPSIVKGSDLPVMNVSWQDAQDFCKKLTVQSGHTAQLPTEAQWEYACRAGTTTAYNTGDTIADLDKAAWHGGNAEKKPHPVGQKAANAWGIYDMHGNAREFVQDLYADAPLVDATDPTGPKEGDPKNHVVRGAAYTANAAVARNCRSASRRPTEALQLTGFRFAVLLPAVK